MGPDRSPRGRSTAPWRLIACVALLIGAVLVTSAPTDAAAAPGAPGPVDDHFPTAEVFVDRTYRDVLSRPPDAGGLAAWSTRLRRGLPEARFVSELLESDEFAGTTAPVIRLYRSIFDRRPDLEGLRFWVGERRSGQSLARLADRMLNENEFDRIYRDRSTVEIVTAVYRQSLGREPDPGGLRFWSDELDSGRRSLATFVVGVSESPEQRSRMRAEILTSLVFLGMLGRLPEPGGLAYWTSRLNGGLATDGFVSFVLDSPEYRGRFAPAPTVETSAATGGLSIPWDLEVMPPGDHPIGSVPADTVLFTERGGRIRLLPGLRADGVAGDVTLAAVTDAFVSGETGVMGLALDPSFTATGRFYVCHGHRRAGGGNEIRVTAWRFQPGTPITTSTVTEERPVVTGIPIGSGRHGGCQLEVGVDGALYVGTGDAARGTHPQNRLTLAGNVLRVDPGGTNAPATGNPFTGSSDPAERLVFTYGHRNVQGLADRGEVDPALAGMWSIEHGPSRDDEVNRLRSSGNAGWNPVGGAYNESVPMTDRGLTNTFDAAWATGTPTLALSSGEWLDDPAWGSWRGALAVTALKGRSLRLLFFSPEGTYLGQRVVIDGAFGRLRGATEGPDGALWLTTSRGSDSIVRIRPG